MSHDTYFKRRLRSARASLVRTGLLLALQAFMSTAILIPLMVLLDGLVAPEAAGSAEGFWLAVRFKDLLPAGSPERALFTSTAILGAITLVSALLEFTGRVSVARVAYTVVERLREDLFSQLITRRQNYLDRKRKSDLVTLLSSDAGALESLIDSGLTAIARAVPTLLLSFAILIPLQPALSILLLAALPLLYRLNLYFSRSARRRQARLRSETRYFESEATRLLAAGPVVKSLTLEPFTLRSVHSRLEAIGALLVGRQRADGARAASAGGARRILRALLLALGGALVLNGQLSIGGLAAFLVSVGALSRSVNAIARFASDLGRAATSLERVEALFAELENQGESQGGQAFISLPFPDATTVHFEDVSFGYPGAPLLLQNFSASFHAGELIALTGPSGGGRTTFSRLINRLLDPIEGRIALGRTDLRRFRLDVLRTYVTVVDHELFFVPGTVRENLLLGAESSEVREQQISEALHGANAYDFIQSLPEKLDTAIGDGGVELSASQLRRLSLARAFLRDQSQVFVLDEPTTGLDADSAAIVAGAIHKLAERGAMVFWITNRLEEIPQADRVVLFSRIRDPRLGTHESLMAEDAVYRSYFAPLGPPRAARGRKPEPAHDPKAHSGAH